MVFRPSCLLRVDLTKEETVLEETLAYSPYLGGRGTNQRILFDEMPLGISPFDSSSIVAIGAGLLCGTDAPGAVRTSIDTKNVFTGGIGSSSVGGGFASALARAGISNIIIAGRATTPCYLYINDGLVELRDASHLRGKRVSQVDHDLTHELGGDFQTMVIGPAGEHQAWAACLIVNGGRAAGRSGAGAVFGSKNLKAISVAGSRKVTAAREREFSDTIDSLRNRLESAELNQLRNRYGVYCYPQPWDKETPYRNFSGEVPPLEKKAKLGRDQFQKYLLESSGCESCPIACWTVHEVKRSDGTKIRGNAFQANAVHNFGLKLDMHDVESILEAHALCDDLGLDQDVSSNVIAWAIDCYERGLLTSKETEGLELRWGDTQVIFTLIEQIAYRKGFGSILSEGCLRASKQLGIGSEYCMHIKGNDLFECLWTRPAWSLGVVVSPRGGTHTRGALMESRLEDISPAQSIKFFGTPWIGSQETYHQKEKPVVFVERLNAVCDCLGMCMFTHSYSPTMMLPDDYAKLISAFTGLTVTGDDLLLCGERVHTLEKCFNILHTQWLREDDLPPRKFVQHRLAESYAIDMEEWNKLLDRYYEQHAWDTNTGWPRKGTLLRVGLSSVLERLLDQGKTIPE